MPDDDQNEPNVDSRGMPRYPSRAQARVLRETDAMRVGIVGVLSDVSVNGIGILLDVEIPIGETIKIELTNEIQRITRMVRGVVRFAEPVEEGKFQLGIELSLRLAPLDVSLLKTERPEDKTGDGPAWF